MGVGIGEAVEAFELFFESIQTKDFRKSLKLQQYSERQILPLMRAFLLGYFGESLVPEASTELPGGLSGIGRLDFLIGYLAIEFVVRTSKASSSVLTPSHNRIEIRKLMKHKGTGLLVLYDLSARPVKKERLELFRDVPSLGKGPHIYTPFNIAYFSKGQSPVTMNIRP